MVYLYVARWASCTRHGRYHALSRRKAKGAVRQEKLLFLSLILLRITKLKKANLNLTFAIFRICTR